MRRAIPRREVQAGPYLDASEVMALLHSSRSGLRNLRRTGRLMTLHVRGCRTLLFSRAEVMALVETVVVPVEEEEEAAGERAAG
jgi:hypothetical protein